MEVVILKPHLFIDAQTFEKLADFDLAKAIELVPQMSKEDYELLLETAETAANVGVAVSIWQVLLFFSLGKAMKSMWVLVNVLQFVVYISLW